MIERYVLWIGFQRHFQGVPGRRSAKYVKQRREQGRDGLGREQRRRPAAQVDGFQPLATAPPGPAPGVSRAYSRQLSKHRLHVLPRRDTLAHRDGEVAVGAAALAEGDMQIDVPHDGNLTRNLERGTRNGSGGSLAAAALGFLFRVPRSAFRVQTSPNTIPGSCFTTPRISSSVSAVSTAPVSAPAVATSTSTCLGSVRSVSHNERCNVLRSGGGVRPGGFPSATV